MTSLPETGTKGTHIFSSRKWLYAPLGLTAASFFVGLIFYALGIAWPFYGARLFGVALLVVSAATTVGAFLGFLFALPRDLSRFSGEDPSKPNPPTRSEVAPDAGGEKPLVSKGQSGGASGATASGDADRLGRPTWSNNNLVKISDWLTTMVVGVGLVEFKNIVTWLGKVGQKVDLGAGLPAGSPGVFGVALIVGGFFFGVVGSYVYTRTVITKLLAEISREVDEELTRQVAELRTDLETSIKKDAESLAMEVNRTRQSASDSLQAEATALQETLALTTTILGDLYKDPPESFNKALKRLKILTELRDSIAKGKLFVFKVCALGQKHSFLRNQGTAKEELDKTVNEALEAAREALRLDPGQQKLLHKLWNPEDPGYRSSEGDLRSFWDDAEARSRFGEILSMSRSEDS